MEAISRQFGLMIAYLLPGFIGLLGLAPLVPTVAEWLHGTVRGEVGIGPPVYAVLAATAMGMVISCVRWLLVDHFLYWTGLKPPRWDGNRLEQRFAVFTYFVESHYRYYQSYSGTLIAILWTYGVHRLMKTSPLLGMGTDLGVLSLCAILLAGSRDALERYFVRTGEAVGLVAEKVSTGDVMTNGCHHDGCGGGAAKPSSEPKPETKAVAPAKPVESKSKGGVASR